MALFERAIRLAQPEEWQQLGRDVDEDEDCGTRLFPHPDDTSVAQAVRLLLEEARRAMHEHRDGDFSVAVRDALLPVPLQSGSASERGTPSRDTQGGAPNA